MMPNKKSSGDMFGSEAAAAMAAFLSAVELIPKQESTGDRTILGKISKRGNKYVRTLLRRWLRGDGFT